MLVSEQVLIRTDW